MIVFLDTSVWVDDLRHGSLRPLLFRIRSRHLLRFHSVVAAELLAGCRSKPERRALRGLFAPFEATGRMIAPTHTDFLQAAEALSRLRQSGITLRSPGNALMDAVQAATARRLGSLLVTRNIADFERLRSVMAVAVSSFEDFRSRID